MAITEEKWLVPVHLIPTKWLVPVRLIFFCLSHKEPVFILGETIIPQDLFRLKSPSYCLYLCNRANCSKAEHVRKNHDNKIRSQVDKGLPPIAGIGNYGPYTTCGLQLTPRVPEPSMLTQEFWALRSTGCKRSIVATMVL